MRCQQFLVERLHDDLPEIHFAGGRSVRSVCFERVRGATPLMIRIALKDGTGSFAGGYSSSDATAFALPADSAWHHASFPLTTAAFSAINSPGESVTSLLAGPAEFRILSSSSPSLDGDAVTGPLGIDNIAVAVPEPTSVTLLIGAAGVLLGKPSRR